MSRYYLLYFISRTTINRFDLFILFPAHQRVDSTYFILFPAHHPADSFYLILFPAYRADYFISFYFIYAV